MEDSVKLLLTYDPLPKHREEYFRYVLGEFVPALENLGLTLCEAWHTAYGEYPLRLTGFIAEDRAPAAALSVLSLAVRLSGPHLSTLLSASGCVRTAKGGIGAPLWSYRAY